jgi:phosphatidylserine/phosphatidylglycerophosphate/cardiolipin synthase-like enzyme
MRAMLRDGKEIFLGSMSLRAPELDKRREVGVILKDHGAAKRFREIFEEDWAKTDTAKKKAGKDEKMKEKEEKQEAAAAAS